MAFARLPLSWRLNVNWDEFFYLSLVHDYLSRRLALVMQTIHVYPFAWVASVSNNEVDQIVAARLVYWLLSIGSCMLLYTIARSLVTRSAALFVALCYLSYSNILQYAMTFRVDGLAVFCALAACACVVRSPLGVRSVIAAGCLTAASLLVTLKSIFIVPTVGLLAMGAAWAQPVHRRAMLALVFALSVGFAFGIVLFVHSWSVIDASMSSVVEFGQHARRGTVGSSGFFPGWPYLVATIGQNGFVWIFLVAGCVIEWRRRATAGLARRALVVGLLLPLVSLLFYRNTFPYYYVFVLPPALVLCGVAFEAALSRSAQPANQRAVLYMIAAVTWAFSLRLAILLPNRLSDERRVLDVVHTVFPRPVPYIDRNSMVASYPKVGFFMTTWGMQDYRARGIPIFERLLRSRSPQFLIVNSQALALHDADTLYTGPRTNALLPEDLQTLRDNFVHLWGPLYVAGKRSHIDTTPSQISVLIAGTYVVDTDAPVMVDKASLNNGDSVLLAAGFHEVAAIKGTADLTLRIVGSARQPGLDAPQGHIYVGF